MLQKEEVLARAKELMREELTNIRFNSWIKPIEIAYANESSVCLLVKTDFHKAKLEAEYLNLIVASFSDVLGKDPSEITLEIAVEDAGSEEPQTQTPAKTNIISNVSAVSEGLLNPKYTFESFVIGKSNELAHAAALATAENPGKAYNPLFLYGGVGLGKTHLMQAVGNYVLAQNRNAKILYTTSEKFTNELINAIQNNKNIEFRAKYRNLDLLLIDDIQFLSNKERSQEEFFHTFNELYENSKQIVISSDRPPKDINPLEDRLRSRFEWGLIADISKPDYETRYAILRKKSELENILIDDEILSTLAFRIESNIRELEGTLNKMVARASLTNAPLTMQLAEQCISELQHSHEKAITIDYIQEAVAKYYNIDKEEFNISRRSNDIAFPRQIAMYLSKQLTGQPLAEIGKSFGGRDHTTVIYAINKIESAMKNNPNTKMIVDNIKKTILG